MIINMFPGGIGSAQPSYDPVLANNTPAQIKEAARAGVASTLWSVGDKTSAITISASNDLPNFTPPSGGVCAFILGFDHNSTYEGTGITFMFGKTSGGTDVAFVDSGYNTGLTSGTYFNMNNSTTRAGGWKDSRMRTVVCPAFLSAMPQAWQDVISSTNKYTDNNGNHSTSNVCTETQDSIFLLGHYEVFGTTVESSAQVVATEEATYQKQYAYYVNGASKVKYKHDATTTACHWRLRSQTYNTNNEFRRVSNGGATGGYSATYSIGFAPAFRVA